MRSAAAAIGPASASIDCNLRCADSEKFSLMRATRSMLPSLMRWPLLYRSGRSFTNYVGQPLDFPRFTPDQHGIEAAGAPRAARGKVMAGGCNEATALRGCNAGCRAAEGLRTAGTHLHEHQNAVGCCHDVDFAEAAAVVALQDLQSLALEEGGGETFVGTAAAGHGRSRTTSLPSVNCAAVRPRMKL